MNMTDESKTPGRILVVEDEGVVAMDIKKCLSDAGLEVTGIAASADDAVSETERIRPDLVLMDIRIQGALDGVATAELLQRRYGVPTVYLTAQGDSQTIERVKRTHPLSFLRKPFRESELLNAVAIALENARSERELQEREQSFAAALNSIGDAVISTDESGLVRFINHAGVLLTGWTREAALGRSISEVVCRRADQEAAGPSQPLVSEAAEFQICTRDGSLRWVTQRMVTLAARGGRLLQITVLQDVTAWKQSELVLRRQANMLEQLHEAVFTCSRGAIGFWNRGAERLYGFTRQEAIGSNADALLETGYPMGKAAVDAALERYGKWSGELSQTAKDGRLILVDCVMSLEETGGGAVLQTNRDITARRRAEEQLARSEERYRSLVRATTQIVWITEPNGEVTQDVPQWREFTAQSCGEVKGSGWLDALHPDDHERTRELWGHSVKTRSFYRNECRVRRHDGEYRWMDVNGVPVFDTQGGIREWIGACADITERVRAEEEVRQLNQTLEKRVAERTAELQAANGELEAFAYSVSHDLRAPLRAMDGFSRILLEEQAAQQDEETQRYLRIVRDNALQMGKLIDGLLSFSRLGRQALNRQTVSSGALVQQALVDLAPELQGRQVEIGVGEMAACNGDPLLLKQVFFNLLSNAFKYTRKCSTGRIEVGCFPFSDLERYASKEQAPGDVPADTVVFYVRDNGAGFDMRYARKLFGVFQRLHRAEEYEGTGVGLAIVLRIVSRHGGRVWAEGALNQGATFYFTIPARLDAPEEPDERP